VYQYSEDGDGEPLYTAPVQPALVTLTDEHIGDIYYSITKQRWTNAASWVKVFARAIEAVTKGQTK
jgi:hypothetical protein